MGGIIQKCLEEFALWNLVYFFLEVDMKWRPNSVMASIITKVFYALETLKIGSHVACWRVFKAKFPRKFQEERSER